MAAMGRKRTTDTHLPARMYRPARMHYFVDRQNKWHKLGRDYPKALILGALNDFDSDCRWHLNELQKRLGRGVPETPAEAVDRVSADNLATSAKYGFETGAKDSPCGCMVDRWGKVQCEERSGSAHTYCKWERQQEIAAAKP